MSKINIHHADSSDVTFKADIILTDPPFDMPGDKLAQIINSQNCNHLLLITTMTQLLELHAALSWTMAFDFVFDSVAPKKSKSIRQPNYTHHTGVYMYRPGDKSKFNRKLRQRSDVFEGNGYWPTIFHAPAERRDIHSLAKNSDAFTDLLGSFDDVRCVLDLFAGSGTTGIAAFELDIDAILVESSIEHIEAMKELFRFLGC